VEGGSTCKRAGDKSGEIGGSTWRKGCYPDLWFQQIQFLKSAKNGDFDAKLLQKTVRLCTHNRYLKKRMKKNFVARTQEYIYNMRPRVRPL